MRPLVFVSFLLLLVGGIFIFWPSLDLFVSGLFYRPQEGFTGINGVNDFLRWGGRILPFLLLLPFLWQARSRFFIRRDVVFLVLSLALAPGLVVNVILKDHMHRPRPAHISEFGGNMAFQPIFSRQGMCDRNCSFVSGESSLAAWTLAPALLLPGPWQWAGVTASLVFTALVGLLRMAYGGHFLSDVLIAILLTQWIILVLYKGIICRKEVFHA